MWVTFIEKTNRSTHIGGMYYYNKKINFIRMLGFIIENNFYLKYNHF